MRSAAVSRTDRGERFIHAVAGRVAALEQLPTLVVIGGFIAVDRHGSIVLEFR